MLIDQHVERGFFNHAGRIERWHAVESERACQEGRRRLLWRLYISLWVLRPNQQRDMLLEAAFSTGLLNISCICNSIPMPHNRMRY